MTKKKMLLAASVAGLMAAALAPAAQAEMDMSHVHPDDVNCYGVNKCKGTGDCGGKGASCAGSNACKGQGFIALPEDTCLKIQGGRLTAEE